ncbi:hypothetical protein [Saccharopolyspora sp. NPDC002376]
MLIDAKREELLDLFCWHLNLIFQGSDELVLSCTRRGFALLRDAVADADRELIARLV